MKSLKRLARITKAWDRYWFSPVSLHRLAVCRLLAFGLLIVDLVYLAQWDWVFYREIDPFFWEPILFLHVLERVFGFGPPPPFVLCTIYLMTVILAVGAFVGYHTRICALGSSVLYMYLIAVAFSWVAKVHHTHGVFVLLLLALSLSPCGAAVSVDALIKRMQRAVDRMEFSRDQDRETSPYALWPLRLVGIILCFVYFLCGYAKLKVGGLDWMNGETPALLKPLSIFVVAIELTFPVILFVPRLVWLYLPAGLGFHLGTFIYIDEYTLHLVVVHLYGLHRLGRLRPLVEGSAAYRDPIGITGNNLRWDLSRLPQVYNSGGLPRLVSTN